MDAIQIVQNETKNSLIVHSLLNNHLKVQGKLFRPILASKLANVFGVSEKDYLDIYRAGELIHNASLIHDDVVDQAHTRRGQSTLNQIMPNSKAVLAGDYLLATVIAELISAEKFEVLKLLSEALQEMVEGEFLQDSFKENDFITEEELIKVSHKKTGALIAWICESIALTARQDKNIRALCYKMGLKIGIAFQMYDDTLDYSTQSGKEYAKDLSEGLINFATLNLTKLFPELFYPVLQLRNIKTTTYPWTQAQLDKAMEKTKEDVKSIYKEIYQLFDEICELSQIDKNDHAYQEFITFIKKSEQRIK